MARVPWIFHVREEKLHASLKRGVRKQMSQCVSPHVFRTAYDSDGDREVIEHEERPVLGLKRYTHPNELRKHFLHRCECPTEIGLGSGPFSSSRAQMPCGEANFTANVQQRMAVSARLLS